MAHHDHHPSAHHLRHYNCGGDDDLERDDDDDGDRDDDYDPDDYLHRRLVYIVDGVRYDVNVDRLDYDGGLVYLDDKLPSLRAVDDNDP